METNSEPGGLLSFVPLLVLLLAIATIYYKSNYGERKFIREPKFAIADVLIATVWYLMLGFIMFYWGTVLLLIYLMYSFFSMGFSYYLLKVDISRLNEKSFRFNRLSPFRNFGASLFEFQYSFKADNDEIITEITNSITKNLEKFSGFSETNIQTFTDIDKNFENHDSRDFVISRSEETLRGGKVTQLLRLDKSGSMYSIKWWFFLSGVIENAAMISFVIYAPFSMPFWIFPRHRGLVNLAVKIRKIYPAYYESYDLITIVNCANKLTMETLIEELESRDIDTSDLKTQQAQAINISISGGSASFGTVVQGALKNVTTPAGGSN